MITQLDVEVLITYGFKTLEYLPGDIERRLQMVSFKIEVRLRFDTKQDQE